MSSSRPTESTIDAVGPDRYRCQVTVVNPMGLHARPAMLLVELAGQFPCAIRISRGNETKDAKSIMQLLGLSAEMGTTLVLEAEGNEAPAALAALAELVRNGFNEMETTD